VHYGRWRLGEQIAVETGNNSHKMTKPRRRGRRKRNNYRGSGCDNREEEVIISETVKLTTEEP
jgi:hypothetical protein